MRKTNKTNLLNQISITTTLTKIAFSKDSFIIAKDKDGMSITGNVFEEPGSILDIEISFTGIYEEHSKYGKQFKFSSYTVNVDYNYFFLTNMVKGITKKMAADIMLKCNGKFEEIIINNPSILLSIKGIGDKRLKTIIESYNENKHLKQLAEFLLPHGINNNAIIKIYDFYKEQSIIKLKENPYLLTKIRGISFKKADDIALKIGIKDESIFRIESGITFSLMEQVEQLGHTLVNKKFLFDISCENLDNDNFTLTSEIFLRSIKRSAASGDLVYLDVTEQYLTTKYLYDMEKYIFNVFKENKNIKKGQILKDVELYISNQEKKRGFAFGDKQKDIIRLMNEQYNIIFLCGYAGSGKTTIAKSIMDIYETKYGADSIVACALSGVAANRAKLVTNYEGFTIHSLLGFDGSDFTYNEENKLPYSLVMLDESSMVDTYLFYSLLKAIDFNNTVLFIVGDPGQLQSVGSGEIFKNVIDKNLSFGVILDKVFRQSEDQVINIFATKNIRLGKMPVNYADKHEDFEFIDNDIDNYWELKNKLSQDQLKEIREQNNQKIIHSMIEVCRKHYHFINKWKKDIWSYITDFQVVTPMKNGTLGVDNLNRVLQSLFNGNSIGAQLSVEDRFYRFRDKIVHLRNKNMKTVNYNEFKEHFKSISELIKNDSLIVEKKVFNGQLGVIVNINLENDIISVYYPNENYVAFYKEKDFKSKDILHSYALTIHKTQGMEYKYLFIPMTFSHFNMLNNQLMYTAITRGKEKVYIAGEVSAFKRACTNVLSAKRNTILEYL